MKLYVAGGWPFRHSINEYVNTLKSLGYEIVSNWISRENGINTISDYEANAQHDIDEVKKCDCLVVCLEDDKYAYRGSYTEIGCALGLNKPIIAICSGTVVHESDSLDSFSHYCMNNVFFWHKNIIRVKSRDEATEALAVLQKHNNEIINLTLSNYNSNHC